MVLMYHFHYTKLLLGNQQGSLFNLKFPFSLDYVYRHASLINEAFNENFLLTSMLFRNTIIEYIFIEFIFNNITVRLYHIPTVLYSGKKGIPNTMETRKEQKERRRQEIIYAALELFVSKGYTATKITDIANRVNMSTGLLFHYFESKEKLYEELVRLGLEGTAYPASQTCEHALDFFTQFTTQLFAYMRQQPVMAKMFVLMAEAQRSEGTPPHIREIALQVNTIEQFIPIIEWGQKEGTIKEGDPLTLSNAFWCSIQGVAERYATNPEIELPQADWIVDIVKKN